MKFLFILFSFFVIFTTFSYARKIDPTAVNVPSGYAVEAYVADLTVPTTAIFDGNDLIVAESGEGNTGKPRVIKITPDGKIAVLAQEGLIPPVTGLLMVNGKLYVSHKTKISIIEDGKLKDIVTGLPSNGDHQNDKIVLGKDGKIYLGQGTTTNSGVVGVDNYLFGWLKENPDVHEVPCKDITLSGQNFTSDNPLKNGKTTTGAYLPFGTTSKKGQVIKGSPKCGGSIARFNPDGSNFEVYAWGFRNPFGLAIDSNGQLWTNFHGADDRGSRPIFNDPDYLVKVEKNGWYGWPDYFDARPVESGDFNPPDGPGPKFLLEKHPPLSKAFTTYPTHSAANGLAFSPGGDFGFKGYGFSALFGTFTTPTAGINVAPNGFSIAKIDMKTGEVSTFASNKLPGPSYINQTGGFNRPSDVVFGKDSSLYIVDFGSSTLTNKGLEFVPKSGVIWRIYKGNQKALRPNGPILVAAAQTSNDEKKPLVLLDYELLKTQLPHILLLLLPIIIIIIIAVWIIKRK